MADFQAACCCPCCSWKGVFVHEGFPFTSSKCVCVCVCVCVRVQSQVDEVIDVMQENISKVIERGERLEDLQDKSGDLEGTSFWTSTLHILGVIQMPRTPAFRVASREISQLSCGISRRHAPFWSAPVKILRVYKNSCARKEIY